MENNILQIKNLNVKFESDNGKINAVRNVSFNIREGKTLGLVGESGCGKSVTTKTILRLHDEKSSVINGEIIYNGSNILKAKYEQLASIRGNDISMIFQDPMTSLNPLIKVGKQVDEVILSHEKTSHKQAKEKTIKLFEKVGITSPAERYNQYPHEFSGGMQQRIMIAMALACEPRLLLADEPTTALDVTIQAQVLRLMKKLQIENSMAILMITHDLGVVAEICDDVAVMYAGEIVESSDVRTILKNPCHPYTMGLMAAMPKLGSGNKRLEIIDGLPPMLTAENLVGCPFAPRCKKCIDKCFKETPVPCEVEKGHIVSCHLVRGGAANE